MVKQLVWNTIEEVGSTLLVLWNRLLPLKQIPVRVPNFAGFHIFFNRIRGNDSFPKWIRRSFVLAELEV